MSSELGLLEGLGGVWNQIWLCMGHFAEQLSFESTESFSFIQLSAGAITSFERFGIEVHRTLEPMMTFRPVSLCDLLPVRSLGH